MCLDDLERARALFYEGLQHHEQHRFRLAEDRYRTALSLAPDRVSILTNLGTVLFERGAFAEAETHARHALRLEPGNPECRALLEACQLAVASPAARITALERAVATRPDDPGVLDALGMARLDAGEPDRALAHFEAAVARAPREPAFLVHRARALTAAGRHCDAVRAYLDATDAAPASSAVAQAAVDALLAAETPEALADDRIDALLGRALSEPLASPQAVAPFALARLRRSLGDMDADSETLCERLAGSRLLLTLLHAARVTDPQLEAALVAARRRVLDRLHQGAQDATAPAELTAGLIAQTWLTEHCWPVTDAERVELDVLHARRQDDAGAATALVAAALYAPLTPETAETARLLAARLPDPVRAAIDAQVTLDEAVRAAAADVPRLTAIDDATSLAVQAQYERNPYPRWHRLPTDTRRVDLATFLRTRIASSAPVRAPAIDGVVHALNAGCGTGQHPVDMALRIADLDLLAIDLSRASLGYARCMARRHGCDGIRVGQADILRLPALGQQFPLIESAGVLHHMADPDDGLTALAACLAPGGVMRLALYSRAGRRGIEACRRWLAEAGAGRDPDAIRRARQAILALAPDDPRRDVVRFVDFYSTSECRDMLMHEREVQYDLPGIRAMLQRAALRFLGFELADGVRERFRQACPQAAIDDLDAWHAFEQQAPATFEAMYVFWVQRPAQ